MAVSVDSAASVLAGHLCSVAAGWPAVAGGCFLVGAARQSDHLCLAEAWLLGQLQMVLILVVAHAYLKTVSIPDDGRKGLILDQLENMGVSVPTKNGNNQWKTGSPNFNAHKLLSGIGLDTYY